MKLFLSILVLTDLCLLCTIFIGMLIAVESQDNGLYDPEDRTGDPGAELSV